MDELVNEIVSIRGDNLSDILKSFGHLLQRKKTVLKDCLNGVLSLLKSEDNLHKFFRLKLINEFKCHNEVLNILKCGDKFSLKQVMKFDWFFQELQDAQILMNDIMPFLSFCTRMKVINLYSKHLKKTDVIENLFTALHQKYELNLALILLPSCSQKFVTDRLPTFKTKVPVSVFQELFSHYPDLAKEYLEFILESVQKQTRAFACLNLNDYDVLFLSLASSEPKFFMRIYQKYNYHMPYFHLGRRTSKKIIRTDKESFINNFDKYSKIISMNFTRAYLSVDQIEQLQLALFPKSITKFFSMRNGHNFLEVAKKLKREIRAELLLKNFNNGFSRPFVYEEFAPALTHDVIANFPEEVRVKWIEATLPKLETTFEKADLIEFLPTASSIPLLKKMTENQPELNARVYLFKKMFSSLNFNNDLENLPSILSYFVMRFRNDQFPMREQVFSSLVEFKRLLLAMRIDDWKHVNELLKLVKLNQEQTNLQKLITNVQQTQILSFFKKGLPMESHLKNYFHSQISMFKVCNYKICTNSIYEKTCILFFLSEVSTLTYKDEKDFEKHLNRLAIHICKYNLKNKKNRIEISDWLVEKVKLAGTRKNELDWEIVSLLHNCKKDQVFREKLFPQLFPEKMNIDILSFVLKQTPHRLVDNIDKVVKMFFKEFLDADSKRFFSQIRMYTPFELPQKIIQICLKALKKTVNKDNDEDYKYCTKPNAIKILCLLMPSKEFLETVEPYYPKSLKIEYSDEEDELYRIQQEIAQCLKLLNDPPLALVPMKKFAGGDYLKYVVGSINSISLKIPEVEIIPVLKEWMDSRVSVRKHFIRAFLKIAPKEEKCNLLKELFVKENNSSMRLLLFQHTFQFFCQEPCQETFNIFKTIVMKLEPTDTSAIEEMFILHKVADEYISTYIQMLWELVSHKEAEIRATDQQRVIEMIDKEILELLTEEFRETLLKQIFFLANIKNIHTLQFVTNYILYSSDSDIQAVRLDKTMILLKNLITAHWHEYNLNSYFVFPVRKFVSHFVKTLCESSNKRDKLYIDPCSVLKDFKTQLKAILPEESVIEESLLIDFTITFHEHFVTGGKLSPELFFKIIKTSLEKYAWINDSVKINVIQKVLPFNLLSLEGKLILSESLLLEASELCNLIALGITPHQINDDISVKYYKNIIKLLSENPNQNVKIQSSSFLSKLLSTVKV